MLYTDCLGRDLLVGDVITYPVRHGSSLSIYPAVVRGFDNQGMVIETFEVRYFFDWDAPEQGSSYVVHRRHTHLTVTERTTITGLSEDVFIHHMGEKARQQNERLSRR